MSLINKATIINTDVNSGATINLNANSITSSIEVFTSHQDKPKKTTETTWDSVLAKGIHTGFNNPLHTLKGKIRMSQFGTPDTHTTGANAFIDYEYVQDLILNGENMCTLVSDKFVTTTNTSGSINVMLKGYSDSMSNSNVLEYTMIFLEVNSSS